MLRKLITFLILIFSLSACSLLQNTDIVTVKLYSDKDFDKTGDNFNETILNIYPNQKDIYFLMLVDAALRNHLLPNLQYKDLESIFSFELSRDGFVKKLKLIKSNSRNREYLKSRKGIIYAAAPFYAAVTDEKTKDLGYKIIYHFTD